VSNRGRRRGARRVAHEGEIGRLPVVDFRTKVLVERTNRVYFGMGTLGANIAARLGWTAENVWLPDHALEDIEDAHRGAFHDVFGTVHAILTRPSFVLQNPREPKASVLLVAEAGELQQLGLLAPMREQYVEAAIERRAVLGSTHLRLFHLSPRRRRPSGVQLWP
jgi:hypothetical protein